MISTILIAGAGQIGSRHLQGLAHCLKTLDIFVIDKSVQSLQTSKYHWEQKLHSLFPKSDRKNKSDVKHKITFLFSFENLPKEIDIAIVATNADVRPKVIKQILKNCEVQYWILEKFLAQSEKSLDEVSLLTNRSLGVWVNTSRRMMNWQKQIHNTIPKNISLNVRVSGKQWGMACNGIHFVDLVSWWTGETLIKIDHSKLDPKWIKSKRKGFFEITGELKAIFSGGSNLLMDSRLDGMSTKLEIESNMGIWEIDETNGLASCPDRAVILGKNEMQSEMSSKLVTDLLVKKRCDLPKLSESVEMHRVFLHSLLHHWNNFHSTNVNTLPIT